MASTSAPTDPPPPDRRWALAAGIALATGLTVWLTWPVWGEGVPAGADMAANVVRLERAIELLGQGRVDGWQSSTGLGYQAFLFLGPGSGLLVGLVQVLTFGQLDDLGTIKLTLVVVLAGQHAALAVLARSLGFRFRAAGLAAVLSLLVSCGLGGAGVGGLFGVGLIAHAAATPFVLLALAGLARLRVRPRAATAIGAGAAVAAVAVTHVVSLFVLLLLVVALFALEGLDDLLARRGRGGAMAAEGVAAEAVAAEGAARRRLWPLLGLAGAVAAGLSAWVVVPMAAHADLRGTNTLFEDAGPARRLAELWDGTFLVRPYVALALAIGFVAGVDRILRRRPGAVVVVGLAPVGGFVAWALKELVPANAVTTQLPNRSWGVVGLLGLLPLASALDRAAGAGATAVRRLLAWRRGPVRPGATAGAMRGEGVLGAGLGFGLAVALFLLPPGSDRGLTRPAQPVDEAVELAAELRATVPAHGRIAIQRSPFEVAATGVAHPDFWLGWASGRDVLNIFNPESSVVESSVFLPEHLRGDADGDAVRLARLGVTHLVLTDPTTFTAYGESPSFEMLWWRPRLLLLEVRPPPPAPAPRSKVWAPVGIDVATEVVDEEHLTITLRTGASTDVDLAVASSPKWHAEVVGGAGTSSGAAGPPLELPVSASPVGLLRVTVPAGSSVVALHFEPDGWDRFGGAVSALTLGLLCAFLSARLVLRWKARR